MLKAGWIRKANYNSYQMQRLTPSGVDAIEKDIITNGRFSKGAVLDQVDSYGKLQSFDIDPGWDDLKSAFAKELRSKNRYEIGDEAGFASLRQMATTGSAVAGAAIGYSVGGEQGAIIGAGVGLAAALGTPSVAVRVPALFRQSLTRIQNMLSNTNISIKDWYIGKTQRPVDTDMQSIIDKQNTSLRSGGAPTNLLQRMGQIPGDVLKQFDPLIFVNDRLGPVMSRIMNLDTRGKQFRDLNGRLSIDDSPYVIATNAIGGGSGAGEVHLLAYKGIFQDAHESGSLNEVYKYLNLKGYKRVWDVLQDRMWTMDSQINNLQQQLFAGQFGTPRERIAAEDQLADVNKQKAALQDQMAKGKVTPDNYDPAKINNSLIDLQQQLGPAQFSKVEAMGKRVFALNRQVLDQVHNAGIISHEDYQKYTARGDEYIPMHRILEQVSDNEFQTHGSSPLYLKQQNVINALRGSGKVNVNPIVASADANLQALKEVARNGVIHNFVQLANKDPKGVGQLFTEVAPGYKPKAGESTVGWYDNGKQRTYAVPDYLGATLQHASPISVDTGMGAMLRFTKNVLQAGATSGNLAWSLPNAIRHFGDMAIMSKAGLKLDRTLPKDAAMLVKTWGEALKSTLAKDQSYQEYVKSGAAYSTLQRQITPEAELDPNQIGKAPNWRTRPLDAIRRFNQAIEDTTKLTTFKRLKQMGYSDTAAAFETRRYGGGPDFARMGAGVSNINQIAMFFNAHLQYVARTFQRVGEDPVRMAMFMGALSTIALSLNQHNWQYKLPNGQPSMQAVPVSDRENNFVIMTGDSYITENGSRVPQYYKVPKPSVLKFLYNPIEQVVNGVAGRETRSGTQQTLDTLSAYVPGQLHADVDNQEVAKSLGSSALANLNPLLSVPGEQAMNYQAFGERPIVPQRLQGVEPGKQSTPTTPEVYKEMGQGGTTGAVAGGTLGGTLGGVIGGGAGALVGAGVGAIAGSLGMSPLRLQQAVNGTTGGIGQAVAGIGDFTSERNFPFQGQQATRQIPGVGTLASRFIGTPINQRDKDVETKFYSQLDQVSQVQRTYQSMANTQPQQAGEYLKKNIAAYRAAVVGSEMKKEIGELNSIIAMTQDSNNIPEGDKIKRLESLHATKMKLLDTFNGVIQSLSRNGAKNPPEQTNQLGAGVSR
jgi:hypothetical protein